MAYHFEPRMYMNETAVPLPSLSTALNATAAGEMPEMSMEAETKKPIYMAYIILLSIMLVYVTIGTCMERRKCGFGHETGVVILLGIAIGAILRQYGGENIST